jgi:biopolymer transport protein ExbB/TolQ
MNAGALLQSGIYLVSSSLLYPAMAILLVSFLAMVAGCGAFAAEWSARSGSGGMIAAERNRVLEPLRDVLSKPGASWTDVDSFWRDIRRARWKRLDYLRIFVRLGPSMGLIGTLVPMSTGLASLSQGDMSRLSSDLVVAFSTTVVGLAVGTASYVLYTLRARWVESDLDSLQAAVETEAGRALGAGRAE